MSKTIILEGNQISTQNAYGQRGSIRYMKKNARDTKNSYIKQVKEQWGDDPMLEGDLYIRIKLIFGDKRRRDRDNRHKVSMDAMEGIVFEDDSQIRCALVDKTYSKGEWKIIIQIMEYQNMSL